MGVGEELGGSWSQILAVLIACMVSLTCGILFSWPSPSIAILRSGEHEVKLTLDEASYLTVLPPAAVVIFAFPVGKLADAIGRKYALMLIAVPQLLSWTLVAIGNSIWVFYLSRFIAGSGDALVFAILPVYIGEVSTPKIRGTWGTSVTLFLYTGNLLMNYVGATLDIRTTAYVFSSIPLSFLVLFYFMPETPYYYLMKGRTEEAKRSLQWLRRKDNVDMEMLELTTAVNRQMKQSTSFRDLFKIRSNFKALLVGIALRFGQQFCGISSFQVYSQTLFDVAGGDLSAKTSAVICAGTTCVSSIGALYLLDKLGRRIAVLTSGIGCIIMLILMGTFLYLNQHSRLDLSEFFWFPVVGMIIFIIFYAVGLGAVPTLMLGELFSSGIKGYALAMLNVFFGIFIASSTKIFQLLLSAFGLYAPFYFFAACCTCGTVVNYFLIPETKGKTLDEIQLALQGEKHTKVALKQKITADC